MNSFNSAPADRDNFTAALRRVGLIQGAQPRITSLTGGVSSEIYLVEDDLQRFVVKRALAKLRVRDDWFADVSRNAVEQAYLSRVGALLPNSVPRVLAADREGGWFAMEYFGGTFSNWKRDLLSGRCDALQARRAGETLGTVHRSTWADPELARAFDTGVSFHQLRIEPYLETTANRVPALAALLRAEAERLASSSLALVHGDFSPKNILVSSDRLVLLDAEAAWYGDPAFDVAFLLTHLLLKATPPLGIASLPLAAEFWTAYRATLGARCDDELEARSARLLLCLMLARVHGKSPVEYLTEPAQRGVTRFVHAHLAHPPKRLADLTEAWRQDVSWDVAQSSRRG